MLHLSSSTMYMGKHFVKSTARALLRSVVAEATALQGKTEYCLRLGPRLHPMQLKAELGAKEMPSEAETHASQQCTNVIYNVVDINLTLSGVIMACVT